ncbi:MAG TPA: hypothetical protein PKW90_22505, partial [Myxococcota bacterium]|nr:hypothetical protein [Myxococcota bacterium]
AGPVSSTGRKMPQASLCIAQQVQAVHVDEEGLLWVAEDRLNSGELCPPGVQWIGRLAGAPVLRCNNVLLRWEGGGWRPLHPEPVSICAAHGRKVAFYDGKLCLRWPDGELEVLDPPDAAPTTLLLQRGMLWVGDGEGCIYRYAVGKPQQGRVEEVYPTRLGPVRTLVVKEGELHAGGEGGLLRVGRRPMLEARLRRRHHRAMHSLCHRSDVLGNSVAALIWLRWTDPLYA